jgi:hypothetical protein
VPDPRFVVVGLVYALREFPCAPIDLARDMNKTWVFDLLKAK